jgi:hypothetical protein
MPMPPYPVLCYRTGCQCPAIYKVAARWSDGVTEELKTYSLCCAECLPKLFHLAQARRAACRLAPGETIDPPAIFEVHRGARDRDLTRLPELERQLMNASSIDS